MRGNRRQKVGKKNVIIRRLSMYLRTLDHLKTKGVEVVSSLALERIEGVPQSLVRRDLAEFGSFGVRGVGYKVSGLREAIAGILGFDRMWKVVLVGSVGFSHVLMHSASFRARNLEIVQLFDSAHGMVGTTIEGIPVRDISRLEQDLDSSGVDLAIVAVPPPEVQSVLNRLGALGVKGALYFASRPVSAPDGMAVLNVDITLDLGVLTHNLR